MKLTKGLRDYLLARGWIKDGDTDDVIKGVVSAKLLSGDLAADDLATLTKEAPDGKKLVQDMIDAAFTARGMTPPGTGTRGGSNGPTPLQLFGGGGTGTRSGAPSSAYATTKAVALHRKYKTPVDGPDGAPLMTHSRQEAALAGAFLLYAARSAGVPGLPWDSTHQALLDELIDSHSWTGETGGQFHESIRGGDFVRKALLDDSVSGGTDLVPIVVDSVLITEAILQGELLPFVTVRPVSARQVKSPTLGTPSLSWGLPEGTEIPLFDTTGLIGKLTTSIFTVTGAVEVGLDLMADSAPDIGEALISVMGSAFGREADRVIALGDGVSAPLGIFNTAGITAVGSAAGVGGPVGMSDYESLFFALPKAIRDQSSNVALIGNDLTYSRLRTIPVGATFNTRAFGDALQDYRIGNVPFRVVNSLPNNKLACVALKRYTLFKRAGFVSRWEVGGKELSLKNLALLISRGRFGGRLTDVTAAAVMSDLAA